MSKTLDYAFILLNNIFIAKRSDRCLQCVCIALQRARKVACRTQYLILVKMRELVIVRATSKHNLLLDSLKC